MKNARSERNGHNRLTVKNVCKKSLRARDACVRVELTGIVKIPNVTQSARTPGHELRVKYQTVTVHVCVYAPSRACFMLSLYDFFDSASLCYYNSSCHSGKRVTAVISVVNSKRYTW